MVRNKLNLLVLTFWTYEPRRIQKKNQNETCDQQPMDHPNLPNIIMHVATKVHVVLRRDVVFRMDAW